MGRPRGQPSQQRQVKEKHLVVRLGSHIKPVDEAIEEHISVLSSRGRVWFAKVGKVLGRIGAEKLREQMAAGVATYLFIAVGHRARGYKLYRCRLEAIRYSADKSMAQEVPPYYIPAGIIRSAGAWLSVSSIEQDDTALTRLRVVSSHLPLLESMSSSSSATFFVNEEPAKQDIP